MTTRRLIHQAFQVTQFKLKQAEEGEEGEAPQAVWTGVIYELGKSKNPSVFAESTLESGAKVFPGAYMFVDHPSAREEWEQPERSVDDIAGRVVTAFPGESPVTGKKALMGDFMISESRPDIATKIKEGIITGLSINAYVNAQFDEELGAWIVESFADPEADGVMPPSVDLVTYPAAGGLIAARESYRQDLMSIYQGESTMPPEVKPTTDPDVQKQLTALQDQLKRRDDTEGLADALRASLTALPNPTVTRIMESAQTLVSDYRAGTIADLVTLKASIDEMVKREKDYAALLTRAGVPGGVTKGWSFDPGEGDDEDDEDEDDVASIISSYTSLGK